MTAKKTALPAPEAEPKPVRSVAKLRKPARLEDPDQPRRLGVDERRAQLIALGRRLFTEQPYDALSIDDIARAAGISKGLLYHYFPSKRDFYVATVDDSAQQLLDVTRHMPDLSPPEQAIKRVEAYLDFVEGNAGAFVTLLRSGVGTDREVARVVDGTRDALVSSILDTIGASDRVVFRLALRSWVGLVEAASLEWIEGRKVPRQTVAMLMLHTLRGCIECARMLDPEAVLKIP